MLSRYVTVFNLYMVTKQSCSKQKNHTGVYGTTGPSVVRSAEVEYLIERENVSHQNVHIHTIKTVMEMIMKRRSVMNNAVQVCQQF